MTPERRAQIADSDVLLALVTDAYFANPAWREDVAVAVELGKPVVFLIRAKTRIPPGALQNVSDIVIWRTQDDLAAAVKRLGLAGDVIDGELPETSTNPERT